MLVAAYAFGRPHLLSVLPGIAIASSLVPPVAASGLSLIAWDLSLALGAALLFLSNFVAIVLGAAFFPCADAGPRIRPSRPNRHPANLSEYDSLIWHLKCSRLVADWHASRGRHGFVCAPC